MFRQLVSEDVVCYWDNDNDDEDDNDNDARVISDCTWWSLVKYRESTKRLNGDVNLQTENAFASAFDEAFICVRLRVC